MNAHGRSAAAVEGPVPDFTPVNVWRSHVTSTLTVISRMCQGGHSLHLVTGMVILHREFEGKVTTLSGSVGTTRPIRPQSKARDIPELLPMPHNNSGRSCVFNMPLTRVSIMIPEVAVATILLHGMHPLLHSSAKALSASASYFSDLYRFLAKPLALPSSIFAFFSAILASVGVKDQKLFDCGIRGRGA